MKRFVCFPILNIEDTEKFLVDMEKQGYRLNEIKFSRLFYFVKSKPKDVKYLIKYRLPRDFPTELNALEEKLKIEYKALEITTKLTKFDVLRITSNKKIDDDFFECRKKYLKSVKKRLFLLCFFMVLWVSVCFILNYIFANQV